MRLISMFVAAGFIVFYEGMALWFWVLESMLRKAEKESALRGKNPRP